MTVFHRNETRDPLPEHLKGGVIAIGNFDGVHRGHQSVLNRALDMAKERGVPALVLTFEPHPRTVFRPDAPVFRLTPAPLKARILEELGFNAVIEYPFDYEFSQRSAEEFIHSILKDWLGASEVVTGFDFHFGRGREGGPAFLMDAGNRYGFGVTLIDAFRDENTDVVSSSHIRALLKEGDVSGGRRHARLSLYGGSRRSLTARSSAASSAFRPPTCGCRRKRNLKAGIYAVRFRLRRRHALRCGGKLRPAPDGDRQRRAAARNLSFRFQRRSLRPDLFGLLLRLSRAPN